MKLYKGITEFDCEVLLKEIQSNEVTPSHGHMNLEPNNPFYDESVKQMEMLKTAGYSDSTVEYRHYKAGTHFNNSYSTSLGQQLGVTPLMCWVSEIRPGKCTPWHWDINPWEKEHEKLGEIVRFFCFLSKPEPGHIFVTDSDAYYLEPQGSIYQYSNIHDWHAGTNVGLVPKFLLTLTAYK
jgi:hypothetical protein